MTGSVDALETSANFLPTGETLSIPDAPILVLGVGSQLHDQIPWALAEEGYRSDMVNITGNLRDFLKPPVVDAIKSRYRAVVISGSKDSVNDPTSVQIPAELTDGSIPTLGICYGAQVIAKNNGGLVGKFERDGQHAGEYGRRSIDVFPDSVAFRGLTKTTVLMSHGDSILSLPLGSRLIGSSSGITAAFELHDEKVLGLQFHPEATETDDGKTMLANFMREVAKIEPEPHYGVEKALEEYLAAEEANIAEELVAGHEIIGFVSGGVDSSVSAAMVMKVARELGREDQVTFYYIDSGAMRVEDQQVIDELTDAGIPVVRIDAKDRFFHGTVELINENGETFTAGPLTATSDPDIKRRINGKAFLDIADEIKNERRLNRSAEQRLLQGTNASDFVESGGHGGSRIKSHHNVSKETEIWRENGWLLEPMIGIFKLHVRMAARHYGLSERLASRQPFPGPGETIRIVDNHDGKLEWPQNHEVIQSHIDAVTTELANDRVRAHYVPLTVSGARGDEQNNKHVVVLDGEKNWPLLHDLSQALTDRVHAVCRVLYAPDMKIDRHTIAGATVSTNEQDINELVELEEIKRQVMEETGIDPQVSQHFLASLGFSIDASQKPVVALRCFITGGKLEEMADRRGKGGDETFLLGVAALPGIHIEAAAFDKVVNVIREAAARLGRRLVYDLTNKPPGTTEFQ